MIQIRRIKGEEVPLALRLVDDVFSETYSMDHLFPSLFSESSTFSYVAEKKGELLGFLGIVPECLIVSQDCYYGARVGAVCVSSKYQGQGIGRQLFNFSQEELKAKQMDYLLISGQGKLYLDGGCELFGEFGLFNLTSSLHKHTLDQEKLLKYNGQIEHLTAIHRLRVYKSVRFERSLRELQRMVTSASLANLFRGEQKIFLLSSANSIDAVAICIQLENELRVIEYEGLTENVQKLLTLLSHSYSNVTLRVPVGDQLYYNLIANNLCPKRETNAGTILYFNEKMRKINFPHTWDLGFI